MGEAGAEAILPLKRGSDGKLGVANSGGGGSNVQINIIDQRSGNAEPVETQERQGPGGARIIEVLVRDNMKKAVSNRKDGQLDAWPLRRATGREGGVIMGEAGAEAILPLKRGSDGKLGVANSGGGGSNVQINIIDQRSGNAEPVETQERQGPGGARIIEVLVRDNMKKAVSTGKMDSSMRGRFGAQQAVKEV